MSKRVKFLKNLTRITGTLHEDQFTFFIIFHSFLRRMRNVSDKYCRESQNTHFMLNNFSENSAVYEIMLKSFVDPDRQRITMWCMHIACWITKSTNTHSVYVVLNAFLPQQWFHERASILRYTYLACLVGFIVRLWCHVELAQILVFSVGHRVWRFVLQAACFTARSDIFSNYTRLQNFK